jgi:hypothetical protein
MQKNNPKKLFQGKLNQGRGWILKCLLPRFFSISRKEIKHICHFVGLLYPLFH